VKNNLLFIFIFLALTGNVFAESEHKGVEPAQTYILTIDGIHHEIISGTDYELQISGEKHHVALKKSKTRKFRYAGVIFEFNTMLHFSYEALSPVLDHWSLDGNNSVIMVQKYSPKIGYNEIVESFVNQYRQMNAGTELSKAKLSVGGKIKAGKKLIINLGEIKLEQQIFYFSNISSAVVLVLQDTLTDSGANTAEFIEMRNLIQKTLSVNL